MTGSYFELSTSKVLEQFGKISGVCDQVNYSIKTNTLVGEILQERTGSFFSVHSLRLLDKIVDKSRVWYFVQAWSEKELRDLVGLGVRVFVVDNLVDLEVFEDFSKKNDTEGFGLVLRMRLKENTVKTGRHFVYGFYSKQINDLVLKLKDNSFWLGLHFHRKTQNVNEWNLVGELSDVLLDVVFESIRFLNVGGGFPSEYKNSSTNINVIFKRISELRSFVKERNVLLVCEPGRLIAAPSVKLFGKVKQVINGAIVLDCSVYNSCMDIFIADTRLLVKGEVDKSEFRYLVKGMTPDSMDIFRYRVYLSKKVSSGDWIIFLNAGAYNFKTNFWDLQELKTVIVD